MAAPSLQQMRDTFHRNTGLRNIKPIRDVIVPKIHEGKHAHKHLIPDTAVDQNNPDENKAVEESNDNNNDDDSDDKERDLQRMNNLAAVCEARLEEMTRRMEAATALVLLRTGQGGEKEKEKEKGEKEETSRKRKRVLTGKARQIEAEKNDRVKVRVKATTKEKGKPKSEDAVLGVKRKRR